MPKMIVILLPKNRKRTVEVIHQKIFIMKRYLFSFIISILMPVSIMAQSVNVTFTGRDANNSWVQLNRVVITNLTKGWQEELVWPDTTLIMQNGTGIHDVETGSAPSLQLFQNNPNPFDGSTNVLLTVDDAGAVALEITDVNGHIVGTHRVRQQLGVHQFRVTLSAAGTYVMTARQNGKTSSIKMVNNGGGKGDGIEYVGVVEAQNFASLQPKSGTRDNTTNPFDFGDQMEYVGYATINGEECESQHVTQAQESAETIILQFATTQVATTDPFSFSVEDTTFIICSSQCDATCTNMSLNITGFAPSATITQASDILGVRVNLEHASIGDISISLICPNSRSVQLLPVYSDVIVGGMSGTNFGIECTIDGSHCDASDNVPGTGWNYCWSEDTLYAQNNGYCFLSQNIGNDRPATVDSSHLTISYPGETDFVQGQQYYTPYQSFSYLIGCPVNGLWQIRICDEVVLDNGYLFGWGLTFSPDLAGGPAINEGVPCPGTPTLTDIDGNVYNTVQIGNQCWMKENLRTAHYADSTLIPIENPSLNYTEPYREIPNGSISNVHTYGYLYNWATVMHGEASSSSNPSGVQGICPTGWHVPSVAEWTELFDYVGSQDEFLCDSNSSKIVKALASTMGWDSSATDCTIGNNPSENNATGFSVLPAGLFAGLSSYDFFGSRAFFWTTVEDYNPYYVQFAHNWTQLLIDNTPPGYYPYSVRCIKD